MPRPRHRDPVPGDATRCSHELTAALDKRDVPFVAERDDTFPRTPVVQWLQRCAQRALDRDGPDTEPFAELTRVYSQMLRDAGRDARGLQPRADLLQAVEAPATLHSSLGTWIAAFDDRVSLRATLAAARATADDLDALDALQASAATLGDFAAGVTVTDHVAVTTYHSSKGRQFHSVLLPGLQERLMPKSWRTTLGEQRRQFYVALTRANAASTCCRRPHAPGERGGNPEAAANRGSSRRSAHASPKTPDESRCPRPAARRREHPAAHGVTPVHGATVGSRQRPSGLVGRGRQ